MFVSGCKFVTFVLNFKTLNETHFKQSSKEAKDKHRKQKSISISLKEDA
jgi:hypothetical protein